MIHYIKLLFFSICEYLIYYKSVKSVLVLTKKQEAHLCSIKSSTTMFLAGLYYNYLYFFDEETFYNHEKMNIGKVATVYFAGYLITDTYLGRVEYPRYFTFLAGEIHHKVYIVLSFLSLYMNVYNIYLVFMISELPTILLSMGSFDDSYRNDVYFGIVFFMTRIMYHMPMVYHFWNIQIVPYVGTMSSALHLYWFFNWLRKYIIN